MLPRRRADLPIANRAMEREMREFHARMDAMETSQRRAPDDGDINEVEMEEVEVEGVVVEAAMEERLLRAVVKLGAREKIGIPMYEGNLDT
jgi:hypothetical protein